MLKIKKVIFLLIFVLFSFWSLLFAEGIADAENTAVPPGAKVDPALSIMMLEGKKEFRAVKYESIFSVHKEPVEPEIDVIVKTNNSFKDIENIPGLKVNSKIKEFFTATIPLNQIGNLANLSNVLFIEASVKCKKLLDISVPATRADQVRNTLSFKGKNVIVGIIDSGIDFTHFDFRNIDGTTRIRYIWDQTLSAESGESPPSGYNYGVEYNQVQINSSMASSNVRTDDLDGHGTHVAGIAAGNGSGTGNSQPAGIYVGVANEADIIAVKTTFSTSAIVDAVNYIFSKASSLNQAAVINMSLGTNVGSHDGKSSFESSLDSSTGAGKIIVAAAGNDGNSGIHVSGTAPATIQFNANSTTLSYITIWYKGSDSLNVSVTTPDANVIGPVTPGSSPLTDNTSGDGRIQISSSTNISYNNDKEIIIQIDNGGGTNVTKGVWSFTLTGSTSRFDAWSYDSSYTTFVSPDHDYTLSIPATANKVISVGAYTTKKTWKAIDNGTYSTSEIEGNISSFSSRGPTRDGRQKPDLTAPGSVIASSMTISATFANSEIMPDDEHMILQGTSMACPHVTGTIALLLQKDKNLTSELVLTVLTGTTTRDANTGSVWNKFWGYGKLNALAAINSISSFLVTTPEITEHFSYPNPVRGNKAIFNVRTNINADVTIKIYNIAGELVAKLTGDAAVGDNKFEWDVSSAAPGIYFYIVYLKSRNDGTELKTKPSKIAIIK